MLIETNVTFNGCRIWLDGENKRELKASTARLERFIEEFVGNPPKFSTVGKQATERLTKKLRASVAKAQTEATRRPTIARGGPAAGGGPGTAEPLEPRLSERRASTSQPAGHATPFSGE